jgi:xanthine dehydrogenase YagT iron-sulfur-binding subunit
MLDEAKAGHAQPCHADLERGRALSDDEIRERMSGNICRCSAYPNIVAAIREVGTSGTPASGARS